MVSEKEIVYIIKSLKKEKKNFKNTALMDISYSNAFKVLISCIISLRTKDEITAKASERLFTEASTPEKIAKLSIKKIEKLIYPANFYKTKARRIKEISKEIKEKYKGKVPQTLKELMKFKGVGRKTANIVMVYGHGKKHHIPVDTHVHRIPNRLGWISTKKPEETEKELMRIVPKKYWKDLNDLFVSFGQNICKPVYPKCKKCPINKYCEYFKKNYGKM